MPHRHGLVYGQGNATTVTGGNEFSEHRGEFAGENGKEGIKSP